MVGWENGAIFTDDENDSKIIQGHVHLRTALIFKCMYIILSLFLCRKVQVSTEI